MITIDKIAWIRLENPAAKSRSPSGSPTPTVTGSPQSIKSFSIIYTRWPSCASHGCGSFQEPTPGWLR